MTDRRMDEIVRNQRPVMLPGEATVRDACARMHDHKIGAILVTDAAGGLAGIFTGRDLVRIIAAGEAAETTALGAVMTREPLTMAPGRTAIEALRLMQDAGFRHIPVVDGQMMGSPHDLFNIVR